MKKGIEGIEGIKGLEGIVTRNKLNQLKIKN